MRRYPCPTSLVAALLALLTTAAAAPAQTTVHRCTGPDGAVEFRQQACPEAGEEIVIEDWRTGWVPPSGGETDERTEDPPRRDEPARRPAATGNEAAERRRQEQCWNRQRQLDEVSAKLRRGYAPARGDDLRRKRRSLEDYLRQFCR
jgi:hypothetical protein